MAKPIVNGTQKPVGHYEGSRMTGRYWVGGCTCGSGREGHELYDGRGIYCGITCTSCKRENTYQPAVMNGWYDWETVDEQIEPDEDYSGGRW